MQRQRSDARATGCSDRSASITRCRKTQQMLRRVPAQRHQRRDNLGVGDFDLPDRALTRARRPTTPLRFALNGLIAAEGRPRAEGPLRVELTRSSCRRCRRPGDRSCSTASRTGGAGQNEQPPQAKTLEVADNIDWTVGKKHAFRAGLLGEMDLVRQRPTSRNFNGTFTFGGLDQYELGLPTTYTQRIGTTPVDYTHVSARAGTCRTTGRRRRSVARSASACARSCSRTSMTTRNLAPRARLHVDAGQVHRARRLRHLQRLVRVEHLRAGAARERRHAAGRA